MSAITASARFVVVLGILTAAPTAHAPRLELDSCHAKAKGRKLGRPRVAVDTARIASLRSQGRSWPQIASEMGLSVGKVYQAAHSLS